MDLPPGARQDRRRFWHSPAGAPLRQIAAGRRTAHLSNANIQPLAISPDRPVKQLLAALALALAANLSAAQPAPDSAPFFGATLANADNRPVAMSRYRGKPLVVNFWARWCPPCRAEIPELNSFAKKHAGKIDVVGIGIEDDAAAVKAFARDFPIQYPVYLAREQAQTLMSGLGNARGGLPYTLFIDRQGKVIGGKLGMLRQADLDAAAPLLLR